MLDCALVAAALKVTLANRGVLDDIKARIRAEVFSAIESQTVPFPPCPPCPIDPRSPTPLLGRSKPALTLAPQDERKPEPPREVFLINELIREYLEFQGYSHTLSVFLPESAQPAHRCDSSLLARELGVPPAAAAAEMCAPPPPGRHAARYTVTVLLTRSWPGAQAAAVRDAGSTGQCGLCCHCCHGCTAGGGGRDTRRETRRVVTGCVCYANVEYM